MRNLLWPVRTGFVALVLILLPADAGDGRLSGSVLCASELGGCVYEIGSYCAEGSGVRVDAVKASG
jgi:hypothetical protein